eukprot:3709752-Amphidinium_carterae.1
MAPTRAQQKGDQFGGMSFAGPVVLTREGTGEMKTQIKWISEAERPRRTLGGASRGVYEDWCSLVEIPEPLNRRT